MTWMQPIAQDSQQERLNSKETSARISDGSPELRLQQVACHLYEECQPDKHGGDIAKALYWSSFYPCATLDTSTLIVVPGKCLNLLNFWYVTNTFSPKQFVLHKSKQNTFQKMHEDSQNGTEKSCTVAVYEMCPVKGRARCS